LQNTSEVVYFLKEKCNKFHASYACVKAHVNNFFHEVKVGDVDQYWEFGCGTIKGNHCMHQIQSLTTKDPTFYNYRQLSCFCVSCMGLSNNPPCPNANHVPKWTLTKPSVSNSIEVKDNMIMIRK
jgi:hypothetical protein